jgi:molecular chaperone HtpG
MDEFMRRMKEMAQTGSGMSFYGNMPDNYKVTVNGNHPLIKRILSEEKEEKKEQLAKQMFDLALLNLGLLTGEDLTNFVKRSVSLID